MSSCHTSSASFIDNFVATGQILVAYIANAKRSLANAKINYGANTTPRTPPKTDVKAGEKVAAGEELRIHYG